MKDNIDEIMSKGLIILYSIVMLIIICIITYIKFTPDVSNDTIKVDTTKLDSINNKVDSTTKIINDYKTKLKYEVTKAASADSVLTVKQFYELIGRE